MPVGPSEKLAEIRHLARLVLDGDVGGDVADELADEILRLDEWLMGGCALPIDWREVKA